MNKLYPLKFDPIFKERIWGGEKLPRLFNKQHSLQQLPVGETWLLSALEGDISVVSNGFLAGNSIQELIEIYMSDLVGEKCYEKFGYEFPLLIKLIDAADDLSIQVHPNNELASNRHHAWGKSELWHFLDCEAESTVVAGFNKPTTRLDFDDSLRNGMLKNMLRYLKVKKGDSLYIPAGLIHTIGKGIFLAEIQQTSDITYRVYDWDRKDSSGKVRELHIDLALDAIDYNASQEIISGKEHMPNEPNLIIESPFFTVKKIHLTQEQEQSEFNNENFLVYLCLDGRFEVLYADDQKVDIKKGELVLIPADLNGHILKPENETSLLEISLT